MNDLRTAAQQAVEALYQAREHVTVHTDGPWQQVETDCHAAITALLAALAQQDEPVAYTTGHCENHKQKGGCQLHNLQCGWPDCDRKPTTASSQQAEPVESVARECSDPMCACRGGPCAECEEGEREKEIEDLRSSLYFYQRRCEALQSWQSKMRDPERTIVCDILANGKTLDSAVAGDRYTAPPQQVAQQAEPLNLSDRAVQRRLAAQWGYVPAGQAEPAQQTRKDGHYSVAYRCKCGHEQNVTEIVQDGWIYVGSGANWCDGCGDGRPVRVDAMQQQAEPVGWNWMLDGQPYGQAYYGNPPDTDIAERAAIAGRTVRLLYTAPPPPKAEPVEQLAELQAMLRAEVDRLIAAGIQPQRKLVPLTEEEIKTAFHAARNAKLGASQDNSQHRLSVIEIARAAEQASWEKNHGQA